MTALTFVCLFTALIHVFETLALGIRFAGVKTKHVATSISFVNASFLVARLSNMFQAPILGAMVDQSIFTQTAGDLVGSFRYIIFAAFVGNTLGAFLLPTMVRVFERSIIEFGRKGSVPRLLIKGLNPKHLFTLLCNFRIPMPKDFRGISLKSIPHTFLVLNILMVSIYAIGVLASLLAGALLPDLRATAVQLSGIVNGMATIMLALFVDPTGALITDQAVHGKRTINDVKSMIFFLVIGRIAGTLIVAQIIFLPATKYIMMVTQWVAELF